MFVIMTWDEEDSQSSKMAWSIWFPYRRAGFETRKEAEEQILQDGHPGSHYFICEVFQPVTPVKTLALATVAS